MKTRYLIYRHGANTANQSMCDRAPVAICHADSERHACEKTAQHVTCYANQRFEAVPQDESDDGDWNRVGEMTAEYYEDGNWVAPDVDAWIEGETD